MDWVFYVIDHSWLFLHFWAYIKQIKNANRDVYDFMIYFGEDVEYQKIIQVQPG
jgi:hypothetical protein